MDSLIDLVDRELALKPKLQPELMPNMVDEKLVARLVELSPPSTTEASLLEEDLDKFIRLLLKTLNSTPASKLVGLEISDYFALPSSTLPFLYNVLATIESQRGLTIGSASWTKVEQFVLLFDPVQVRYAGREFRKLLEIILDSGFVSPQPTLAILVVQQALLRLDPKASTLTSIQIDFLKLCSYARVYPEALPILDNDVLDIAQSRGTPEERQGRPLCSSHISSPTFMTVESGFSKSLTYQDILIYYLTAATIYAGVSNFERALQHLEIVMTFETEKNPSKIQVEAYKIWICLCLLHHGRLPHMPKDATGKVTKHFHASGKPYEGLAEAFKTSDPNRLKWEVAAGKVIWQRDGTTGLVHEVLAAHQVFAVSSLSSVYESLSLGMLHASAFPPTTTLNEVYNYIVNLITTEKLHATLSTPSADPAKAILRFKPAVEPGEEDFHTRFTEANKRVKELQDAMRDKKHRMQTSKAYVEAVAKNQKNADSKGSKSHGAPDWGANEDVLENF